MSTRERAEPKRGNSPVLRLLAGATPFRVVRRGHEVVGCWFTSRPHLEPSATSGDDGPGLTVFCHGMVRTVDRKVAGVQERRDMGPDLGRHMLGSLSDASRQTLPGGRRRAARDFVASVRAASEAIDTVWTPERERQELRTVRELDGYRGWRVDADAPETLTAVKTLFAVRHRVLARFLGTLDQELVGLLRPHAWDAEHTDEHDALLGDVWPLLDATITAAAPIRSRVLPIIDDFYPLQDILHPLVAWSVDRDDIDDLYEREYCLDRLRRSLPDEPSDLSDLPDPGLG